MFWNAQRKIGFGTTSDWHSVPRVERVTISATYDWSDGFDGDSAVVRLGGKYGIIDKAGKVIAPIQFDWIDKCERGFARVYTGPRVGVWDCTARRQTVAPIFGAALPPGNDKLFAAASSETGKWGLYKLDGTAMIAPNHLLLNHQENGLTSTFNAGIWRMHASNGTVLQDGDTSLTPAGDGTYTIRDKVAKKRGIIAADGRMIVPATYKFISCKLSRCEAVGDTSSMLLNGTTGQALAGPFPFLSSDGKTHIASNTGDDGPFFYLTRDGKEMFPGRQFEGALPFTEQGLAPVIQAGKWGVIDRAGRAVLPFEIATGAGSKVELGERFIYASKGFCWGARTNAGAIVLPYAYSDPMAAENDNPLEPDNAARGKPIVVRGCKGGSAVFTAELTPILPLGAYDEILPTPNYRYRDGHWIVGMRKGKLWGAYDLTLRQEIVLPQWERVSVSEEYLLVFRGNQTGGVPYDTGKLMMSGSFNFAGYEPGPKTWVVEKPQADGTFLQALADANGKPLTSFIYVKPGALAPWGLTWSIHRPTYRAQTANKTGLIDPSGRAVVPLVFDRYYRQREWGDVDWYGTLEVPRSGQLELVDLASGRTIVRALDFGLGNATHLRVEMIGTKKAYVATYERSNGKGEHERMILDGKLYQAVGGDIGANKITFGFTEGLMAVKVGGKFGYMDVLGNMVIAPQFDHARQFAFGTGAVITAGKAFPIDRTGAKVNIASTQLAFAARSIQPD